MKVAIGSDHRGYEIKRKLLDLIVGKGHEVADCGTDSSTSVDYPDIAELVATSVASGEFDRGILLCGTGLGMCIAANKVAGVRAAACHDDITAELSRRHNDANVMCLSADLLGERLISHMVDIWLKTEFESGRHARRLEKIQKIESQSGAISREASHS